MQTDDKHVSTFKKRSVWTVRNKQIMAEGGTPVSGVFTVSQGAGLAKRKFLDRTEEVAGSKDRIKGRENKGRHRNQGYFVAPLDCLSRG